MGRSRRHKKRNRRPIQKPNLTSKRLTRWQKPRKKLIPPKKIKKKNKRLPPPNLTRSSLTSRGRLKHRYRKQLLKSKLLKTRPKLRHRRKRKKNLRVSLKPHQRKSKRKRLRRKR